MFLVDLLKTQRVITDQGFLKVPARLARTGVQEYRAYELGIKDGDPNRRIRVYRPAEEVFSPQSMSSFEDCPVTIEHPNEAVTADNWRQLAVGHVRNIRQDGIHLVGDMTLTDRSAIKALDDGKVEVSNGYTNHMVFQSGTTPDGEKYDAIQTNIRGNHVALVDAARCGPTCRVSDSNQGASKMPTKKITVDGLPLEFDESAVAVIEKVVGDRDTARAELAEVKGQLAAAVTTATVDGQTMDVKQLADALTAANAQIVELKKDIMTPDARDAMVEAWTKLLADSKRIAPAVETKGKTCVAIRREVVAALAADAGKKVLIDAAIGGITVDQASDDQIKTAFAVLAAAPAVVADSSAEDALSKALTKDGVVDGGGEPSGRDAYLASTANAWQNAK